MRVARCTTLRGLLAAQRGVGCFGAHCRLCQLEGIDNKQQT